MKATVKSEMDVPQRLPDGSPAPLGYHTGDPRLVMRQYRRHIMNSKKRWSSARSLCNYAGFIESYLWAKRLVIAARRADDERLETEAHRAVLEMPVACRDGPPRDT